MTSNADAITQEKRSLRKHLRAVRDAIPEAHRVARSHKIAQQLIALPEVIHAASIFIYYAHGSEVSTHALIDEWLSQNKTVAVPRIIPGPARQMLAIPIKSCAELVPDILNIPAPRSDAAEMNTTHPAGPDLIILPGLGFAAQGQRLGQGGGYYDRYLRKYPSAKTIALAFNEQMIDKLPTNETDCPVDRVVIA